MEGTNYGCAAHRGGLPEPKHLTTDAQALNQVLVSFRITAFQVFHKAAAPRDHRQQSPAGMMIFTVRLEMILKLQDALTQDRDLYLWRTSIRFVDTVCCDYLLLGIGCQGHSRIDTPRLNLIFFCPSQDSTVGIGVWGLANYAWQHDMPTPCISVCRHCFPRRKWRRFRNLRSAGVCVSEWVGCAPTRSAITPEGPSSLNPNFPDL